MPRNLTRTSIVKPKTLIEGHARTSLERHRQHLSADLEKMTSIIRANQDIGGKGANVRAGMSAELPSWRTRVSKAERPPTPSVTAVDETDTELETGIVLIQRLLRGRAAQNSMYEGKERRKALIRELRAADDIEDEDATRLPTAERRQQIEEAALDTVAGETVSSLFDFLSKELVRKEEKDRLQSLAHHADEIRRQREAEESGRRQAEERVRAREDEVFSQVMRAHFGAAFSFVDALIDDATERVAAEQAVSELRLDHSLQAQLLPRVERDTPRSNETLVRDLVASFLMPAVERVQLQAQVRTEEKPFLDAAQKSVVSLLEK